MGNLRKLVGERVRMVRKQRGFSQEKLGELALLKNSYIGDVERGTRNISLDSLDKIITALDMDLGAFFNFDEIDVTSNDFDKTAVLEVHKQFLEDRSVDEIKLIHKISRDILLTKK
ncbi:helix-turn-helix transcriptional regulator [Paenibacillus alba]|uniref:helix-turn-helix domain-containing protein n=1 Tax=Paenibacillus alba TaxID=1197127 RepID=UPI00156463D5|nr:helix-turn-helix transcriptional regulator [Paenibacillus alba]NQX69856.1 helix-turn-helix transcriptional regulator [Paenibacillus alba]